DGDPDARDRVAQRRRPRVSAELRAMTDKINPNHYDGDACMRCIANKTQDLRGARAFCIGQAIKYLWRCGRKTGESWDDEVAKALWYLEWLSKTDPNMPQRVRIVIGQISHIIGVATHED